MSPEVVRDIPAPPEGAGIEWPAPDRGRASAWWSHLLLLLKCALAGGLCVWLVQSGRLNLPRLLTVPLSAEMVLLVGFLLGSLILPAVRWWWLLRLQDLSEPFGQVLVLTWVGYFAALVLPGATGGDFAKGYLIIRRTQHWAQGLSTVLADRLLGMSSLVVLGSLATCWLWYCGKATAAVLGMAGITLSLLLALTSFAGLLLSLPTRGLLLRGFPQRWREACNRSIRLYARNKVRLVGCFLLSVLSNAFLVASFTLAGGLLGRAVPLGDTFLVGPLVVLANCLPLSPGGIGVAETMSELLFAGCGIEGGSEFMVLLRVCLACLALPGVVGFLLPSAPIKNQPRRELAAREEVKV